MYNEGIISNAPNTKKPGEREKSNETVGVGLQKMAIFLYIRSE